MAKPRIISWLFFFSRLTVSIDGSIINYKEVTMGKLVCPRCGHDRWTTLKSDDFGAITVECRNCVHIEVIRKEQADGHRKDFERSVRVKA